LSPQLPKLFANETLYQLSYTPKMIKGNYYAIKKRCGKIKADARRSESRVAITEKARERKREWLVWEREDEL
jgi:hypothetical protein